MQTPGLSNFCQHFAANFWVVYYTDKKQGVEEHCDRLSIDRRPLL